MEMADYAWPFPDRLMRSVSPRAVRVRSSDCGIVNAYTRSAEPFHCCSHIPNDVGLLPERRNCTWVVSVRTVSAPMTVPGDDGDVHLFSLRSPTVEQPLAIREMKGAARARVSILRLHHSGPIRKRDVTFGIGCSPKRAHLVGWSVLR